MQWFLKKGRIPFLVLAAGLTAFFALQCLNLKVDKDNRSMTADNPAQTRIEEEFRSAFGTRDSIFVSVTRKDLLAKDGHALVESLVNQFTSLPGIERVNSLVDTDFLANAAQRGTMLSHDGTTTGIRLVPGHFADEGDTLAALVESIVDIARDASTNGTRVAVSGLPVQKYEVGKLVRKDQRLFAPVSLAVLAAVLFWVTRRISGVIFPLLVAVLTICWTMGLLALFGKSLNMITSLLPPVIMTLSVATTIHIYLEWLGSEETNRFKRAAEAVRHLYKPCLFTSATTAIGFLSLCFSATPAVRQFGIFAAVGVGISYLLGVLGLAIGLTFLATPKNASPHLVLPWLDRGLRRVGELSVRHSWKVIAGTALIGLSGLLGLTKIRTDTDLLHFLGNDSTLVADTEFIDSKLDGVSTIDLLIRRSDGTPWDSIRPIREFQTALGQVKGVRRTISIADFLPANDIPPGIGGNDFMDATRESFRVTVCTGLVGTNEGAALVARILDLARDMPGEAFTVRPVGGFYRVIAESNQLVASQIKSFAIAISLILVAIGIVFRSFRYTLLAIVPNVIPLTATAAVMGFSGIALSTGTVMIASVVIGIAVDDTIHYISAYRRSRHPSRAEGIISTTRRTGFVLTATTLALSAGFWVALFGSFRPTVYFALLSGMTMWVALACDLLVLPAFLKLAAPRHTHPST